MMKLKYTIKEMSKEMNIIGNLLRKIGFNKTIEILSIKGDSMMLRAFYEKLLENELYHNSFLRIKSEMLSKELIIIYYEEIKSYKTKRIKLTEKGVLVKQILNALMELIG